MKCQYCRSEDVLPFKCPFCGGYFCAEHRLPEKHGCPEMWKALQRRDQRVNTQDVLKSQEQYYDYEIPLSRPERMIFRVSARELKHLVIGTLIVTGVGFSFFLPGSRSGFFVLLGSTLVFTLTFILHEIAHKAAAQYYGLWAQFRLTLLGSLLTLFSIVSPLKIISPGVVETAGVADKKTIGKVSLAGPATNIILAIILLWLSYYGNAWLLLQVAFLNSWTALFNLIPFSVFDGKKIFWWNNKVWAVSFAASIILTYFALRPLFASP